MSGSHFHSFIHSFISFIHSFIHFIHSFIHSFIHFIHSFIHSHSFSLFASVLFVTTNAGARSGSFETTFVDADVRVSRGDRGETRVFVR